MKTLVKKILVAVNGSQSSVRAAMYGILMAKQYSCLMKVVFVVDTETIKFLVSSNFFIPEERDSYTESLRADGKTYLNYVHKLANSKGIQIETELREGSVWAEVIKASEEYSADMILLGGHENKNDVLRSIDNSYIRKSVVASARSEIVNYAPCPVLVVNKQDIEALFKIS
ncbi:MAG: universal stress protein [Treponema sp.]|nr:universal stress protein [Treponema sp.]